MNRYIENQLSAMTWDALEKGKGRRFTSKFIEPGIIKYSDDQGKPYVALVKKEAIDRFIGSIIGCPLIIKHHDVNKDTVEDLRCGIISEVSYNQADGWYYCSGIVWDENAIKNIEELGWSVSCTYVITDEGGGGVYHDMKYDVEFMNGDFEHLALVENPRYEEATIVLNSKGEPIRKVARDMIKKPISSNETQDNGGTAMLMFQKKSENEKIMEDVKKFISNMKDGIEALCKKVGNEKAKLLEPLTKAMNEAGEAFSVNAKEGDDDEDEKKKKENEAKAKAAKEEKEKKEKEENESEAESAKDDDDKEKENESENESEDDEDEKDEKKAKAKKSKSAKNESDAEDELEKSKKARNEAPKEDAQATGYMTMAEREKLGKELF